MVGAHCSRDAACFDPLLLPRSRGRAIYSELLPILTQSRQRFG